MVLDPCLGDHGDRGSMAMIAQGGDKQAAMNMLYRKYAGSVVFLSSFANLPDLVTATVRKRTPKGITALVDELKAKGLFASMGPRSICEGCFFDMWKEGLLDNISLGRPNA